jgi:tRNA pseudouridine38-40 synthase
MRTFKATLAYDGTNFAGWQMQGGLRTVQGELENALHPIDGRRTVVHAAGRTDAGVHARGQVVSFSLASSIAIEALLRAINVRLPDDVRVLRLEDAAADFNARFHARRKTYLYSIFDGAVLLPQHRHFVWHVRQALDVERMNTAAAALVGAHDFAAFQAAGGDVMSTRREVFASQVDRRGEFIVYEIAGSGFLRHMVRNIVGTLVDVGRGRRLVEDVQHVLESRDRRQASATAPARGLTLETVNYT